MEAYVRMRPLLCILLLIAFPTIASEVNPKLPDPLSLEYSLKLSEEAHPDLIAVEQAIAIAKSQSSIAKSDKGLVLRAQARARWIDPPDATAQYGREDHQGKVFASKALYDFGKTSNKVESVRVQEDVEKLRLEQVKQYRRIEIMQIFFDVLLADLTYLRDNEAMKMAYVHYDKARDRLELGQKSEVDVLEKESQYFEKRKDNYHSESMQRLLRQQLSIVLNRPDDIVSNLYMPKLDYKNYKIIELERLQEVAQVNNLDLKKINLSLEALRLELQSLRANRHPTISAEVEAGIYKRNIGSNDRWRAGVVLDVPLYQGGKISGQIAELRGKIKLLENKRYQTQLQLNQKILMHWLAIDSFTSRVDADEKLFEYREIYLDRARADYELEYKTDLGDSMVKLTQASLNAAETDFELAMRWEQLRILTQMTLEEMRQ